MWSNVLCSTLLFPMHCQQLKVHVFSVFTGAQRLASHGYSLTAYNANTAAMRPSTEAWHKWEPMRSTVWLAGARGLGAVAVGLGGGRREGVQRVAQVHKVPHSRPVPACSQHKINSSSRATLACIKLRGNDGLLGESLACKPSHTVQAARCLGHISPPGKLCSAPHIISPVSLINNHAAGARH